MLSKDCTQEELEALCGEKATFGFDIEKLRDWYETIVTPLPPVFPGREGFWGGWGIWTDSGRWEDGFAQGRRSSIETGFDKVQPSAPGFRNSHGQRVPTSIFTGYITEVMDTIWDLNLSPSRVRVAMLKPGGGTTDWHRDIDGDIYMARLHIPIYTNDRCKFCIMNEQTGTEYKKHFPADGSAYFVSTNLVHRAYNGGDEPRVHIIMDILDPIVSTHHSYPAFIKRCLTHRIVPRPGRRRPGQQYRTDDGA